MKPAGRSAERQGLRRRSLHVSADPYARDPRHLTSRRIRAVLCLSRRETQRMKRIWMMAVLAATAACGDRGGDVLVRTGSAEPVPRDSVEAAQAMLLAESMAVMDFVGQLNNELARAGRLRIELTSSAG